MADENMQVEAVAPEAAATTATPADTTTTIPEATQTETSKQEQSMDVDAKEEPTAAETENKEEVKEETKEESAGDKSNKNMLQTSGDASKNKRFDPMTKAVTDDASEIRAQVEFYFSDSNFPKDEYLWNLASGTENVPVDLKVIHSFKRMQRFQPYEAVVKALRTSHVLKITGADGEEKVARKYPYNPANRTPIDWCIYAKGFGDETPSTQYDIEGFFAPHNCVAVRMRRHNDTKLFKGSVFAEFASEEAAKAFLALDPPPKWKGIYDLEIRSKRDYCAEKDQMIKDGKLKPTEARPFFAGKYGSRGNKRGRGGQHNNNRGGADADDWKARKAGERQNGFRDGGRGGRGRGGRGGGGRGGFRNNDRNKERNNNENGGQKREREDDAENDRPAKKVDVKEGEAPASEAKTEAAAPAPAPEAKAETAAE